MRCGSFIPDRSGATAIEFAMTAPLFFAMVLGIGTVSLAIYAQVALQHGVELAARCATINSKICGSTAAIQNYAASQSLGLSPDPSTFTVTAASCGNQVSASYVVTLDYISTQAVTLTASSCFPK
jgi:Flp pilus assembly protein TadG